MTPNLRLNSIIKWFTIVFVTSLSLAMVPLQAEFWPFSSYPMFNFRFDVEDSSNFILLGFKGDMSSGTLIDHQTVLGAVKRGYLSRYCREKIENQQESCLQVSLEYWVKRYKLFEHQLPDEIQGMQSFKLFETKSNKELASSSIQEVSP